MSLLGRISSLLIGLALALGLTGQDVHVSQFFQANQFSNPARTGFFERGEYRFSALQRTQWRSVTQPFSSIHIAADAHEPLDIPMSGLGFRIMNDRAGDSRFNTFSFAISGAAGIPVGTNDDMELRMGTEIGLTQKRIDDSGLQFDNQFDGLAYDPSADNGEPDPFRKVFHPDIHLGLELSQKTDEQHFWSLGMAFFNINSPDVSFQEEEKVALDQRLSLMAEYGTPLIDDWVIIPSVQWMTQGPHQVLLTGARARVDWVDDAFQRRRGYIGAYARWQDGGFVYVGMDYDEWKFGMSYDVNLSTLEVASRNRGGLELSAIYILDFFNEELKRHRLCPDYL